MNKKSLQDLLDEMYDVVDLCDQIEHKLKYIREIIDEKIYQLEKKYCDNN